MLRPSGFLSEIEWWDTGTFFFPTGMDFNQKTRPKYAKKKDATINKQKKIYTYFFSLEKGFCIIDYHLDNR